MLRGETQGERLRQTLSRLCETLWHTRRRRVHTLGQRARGESRVQTRASVQDAAQAKDVAHLQPRDALGRCCRRTAMPPHPRTLGGETAGGAGDGVMVPPQSSGLRRGVMHEGGQRETLF